MARDMEGDIVLRSGAVEACISKTGAELKSLRFRGVELIWQTGDAWDRSSPVLFPVIGRVENGIARHKGISYAMPMHGFAKDMHFTVEEFTDSTCLLSIASTPETMAIYPFAFRLSIRYCIDPDGIDIAAVIENTGPREMPASFGFHPGFNWSRPNAAHANRLQFLMDLKAVRQRPHAQSLRTREAVLYPGKNGLIDLSDETFADGALFFPQHRCNGVELTLSDLPEPIVLTFDNLPQLALWTPSGAKFICIEPWHGAPDLPGFSGDLDQKPYSYLLAPGATTKHAISIRSPGER